MCFSAHPIQNSPQSEGFLIDITFFHFFCGRYLVLWRQKTIFWIFVNETSELEISNTRVPHHIIMLGLLAKTFTSKPDVFLSCGSEHSMQDNMKWVLLFSRDQLNKVKIPGKTHQPRLKSATLSREHSTLSNR